MKKKDPSEKTPTIGIIIVHYGDVAETQACLQSLEKVTPGSYRFHVFLIDNDPVHRFKEIPKKLPISSIVSPSNGGFAAGINKGIKEGLKQTYDYLLFLNNDTTVHPDFFRILLPYFSSDPSLGLLSPLLVYDHAPDKIWCTSGKINKTFLFSTYPYMDKKISEVNLPEILYSDFGAAALLVKSDVCKTIGLLDEKYFLFGEDIEWCLRAQKAGYKLAYITKPLVRHKVSAGSGRKGTNILSSLGAYLYARNFFYIFSDHRTWFNPLLALIGQLCIRAPFYILFRMRSFSARRAYLFGIRDGLVYLFSGRITPVRYAHF